MAIGTDRLGELLEGGKRTHRVIVSPEGVPLDVQVAGRGERLTALAIDLALMGAVVVGLYILLVTLFFSHANFSVGMTIILFAAFIVRNLYFLHFELAWRGRTPGKKACRLRVINRNGGELTPAAVIARNITREVEIFLPLSLLLSTAIADNPWQHLCLLGWVLGIAALPLFSRDRLRAGDLIGGTQVIAMPERLLLDDLVDASPEPESMRKKAPEDYVFTHEQLAIYGVFELQVLEEFLRRPPSPGTDRNLAEVCGKICRKIGWKETVPPDDIRRFLTSFYTAERAGLERGQLFGRRKEDKTAT